MIHRMYWVVLVALLAWPAGAPDRGVLAIDEGTARHAFSFDSEAEAGRPTIVEAVKRG